MLEPGVRHGLVYVSLPTVTLALVGPTQSKCSSPPPSRRTVTVCGAVSPSTASRDALTTACRPGFSATSAAISWLTDGRWYGCPRAGTACPGVDECRAIEPAMAALAVDGLGRVVAVGSTGDGSTMFGTTAVGRIPPAPR